MAYDATRRLIPSRAGSLAIATVAAMPVLPAVLVPTGSGLAWVAYYVLALGLGSAVAPRTAPAIVFVLLSSLPVPFYFVFGRALGSPGI